MSKVFIERKYNVEKTGDYEITLSNNEESIILDFCNEMDPAYCTDLSMALFRLRFRRNFTSSSVIGRYHFDSCSGKIEIYTYLETNNICPKKNTIAKITLEEYSMISNLVSKMW